MFTTGWILYLAGRSSSYEVELIRREIMYGPVYLARSFLGPVCFIVLGAEQNHLSNLQGDRLGSVTVLLLGLLLSSLFELLQGIVLERFQVFEEFGCRCNFLYSRWERGNVHAGMIAEIQLEWRKSCGGMDRVVVGEFGCSEMFGPVRLSIADNTPEHFFESADHTFALAVRLRVICGRHRESCSVKRRP
jgi:hypothetical protein